VSAKTAAAKAESLLLGQSGLVEIKQRLKRLQAAINADQEAFALVARLNDARERATQVDSNHLDDAFGRKAGLDRLAQAFADFGVEPGVTEAHEAASRFATCPARVRSKVVEALDFLINEEPVGIGVYLHVQGGRVTVAEVVDGGCASASGLLRAGDRLLAIDGVDLTDSFSSESMRAEAYRLLTKSPATVVRVEAVRDLSDPFEVKIPCGGSRAHWARDVLADLDPDDIRTELRDAILRSDLAELKRLSQLPNIRSQPAFTLIQLAGTLFLLERSNSAIGFLEVAQHRHPENFWANHYLGTALAVAHQPPVPKASLRYLTAAVALRPKSLGARMNLVQGLLLAGELEESKKHAAVAAELAPKNEILQHLAAQPPAQQEREENAPDVTPSSQPKPSSQTVFDVATLRSIEDFEAVARRKAARGDRVAALELVKQAAQRFPGDARLRRVKGIVLLDLGDVVGARVALADAARRLPNDAASRFYYGVALHYAGDSAAAIHEYEAALMIRPNYEAVRGYLKELQTGP
jgi:tetratricopeptide (TPR) repeat protein